MDGIEVDKFEVCDKKNVRVRIANWIEEEDEYGDDHGHWDTCAILLNEEQAQKLIDLLIEVKKQTF